MMDARGYKSSGELDEYKYSGTYDGIVVACSWISETDSGKRQTLNEKLQDKDKEGNPKAIGKPRVKVRVNGVHIPDKTKLPDGKLPWADMDVPLTSGSGALATGDTPQIKPGDAVRVRFKNGYIGSPVVIGLNYRNLYENISYTGPNPNPSFGLDSFWENSKNAVLPSFHYDNSQILPNAWDITYSHFDLNLQPFENDLDLPCPKRNDDANAVKTAISNLIKDIERIKRQVNQFAANRLNFINEIQAKVNKYAEIISGWISKKIKWLQEEILKKINAASVATSNALPLNARFPIREGQNILVQAIYCLFNKILDKITDALVNFLLDMIDRFITVPLCAIENLLTSLIGKILGLITSVLGAVASIIGQITGLVTQVLDFIIDLLSLFNCEPNDKCPEVNKWNLLSAAGDNTEGFDLDLNGIIKKAESFAQQVGNIAKTVYDPDTGSLLGVDIDDFDLNFNDVLSDLSCSGAPLLCGPPRISFFGGGGSGASGNTIISSAGELLGIDITSFGSGYSSVPFASIVDDCGKGKGAVVKTKLGIIPPELEFTGKVINSTTIELKWKTKRAKRVQTNFGFSELSGKANVSPTQTTTYTVKAIGKYGQYSEKSLVVTVNATRQTSTIEPGETNDVPLDLDDFEDLSKYEDPNDPNNPKNGESGNKPDPDGNLTPVECPPIQSFVSNRKAQTTIDPEDIGVVSALVVNSGYNYLPAPDGSLGGEGRTWANPEDTIVRRSDGKYELPYSPGSVIQLKQCDYVTPPGGDTFRPTEDTEYIAPQPPEGDQNIIRGISPTTQTGNYPVILYICEIEILNRGIGYSTEDTIKVTPDNGAQLVPTFDSNGALKKVDIISGGIGFTEFPDIFVESKTGFNAQIIAKLCVNRIGDLMEEDSNKYSGQKIISVVDCVGRN